MGIPVGPNDDMRAVAIMQASTRNSVRQKGRSMEFHAFVGQVRNYHSPPSVGLLHGFSHYSSGSSSCCDYSSCPSS